MALNNLEHHFKHSHIQSRKDSLRQYHYSMLAFNALHITSMYRDDVVWQIIHGMPKDVIQIHVCPQSELISTLAQCSKLLMLYSVKIVVFNWKQLISNPMWYSKVKIYTKLTVIIMNWRHHYNCRGLMLAFFWKIWFIFHVFPSSVCCRAHFFV